MESRRKTLGVWEYGEIHNQMNIFETKYAGRLYHRPPDSLYDYEVCADEEGLSRILDEINYRRYHLVTVTQDPEGKYTVIFLKPVV